MRERRVAILTGALLIATAVIMAWWPGGRPGRGARIAGAQSGSCTLTVSELTDTALAIRVTRPNGAVGEITFTRPPAGGESNRPWQPTGPLDASGVVFGDGYPVFATPRFMAVNGFRVEDALKPVSPAIADAKPDDVTVLRGWNGEMAVCLWNRGKITQVFVTGGPFEELQEVLAAKAPPSQSACELVEGLMASKTGRTDPSACAVVMAGCLDQRDHALELLRDACDKGDSVACDLLVARGDASGDIWSEVDDLWRWMLDLIDSRRGR